MNQPPAGNREWKTMAFRRVLSDQPPSSDEDGSGGSFGTPYFWIGIAMSVLAWALAMLLVHLLL